jgi:uncharacterized protein YgiM (DUF1202 family)
MYIERMILLFFMRILALCELVALLTSCSPYVEQQPATPTAWATVTSSPQRIPTVTRSPTPFPSCTVRTGVPAGVLNMRTGAGVGYGVIRVLREGEILKVTQRADWLKVIDAKGKQGFINARYCK